MLNIAIVEDDSEERKKLTEILHNYSDEYKTMFRIAEFPDAMEFLHQYKAEYQIVFMDINMPYMDGLNAAKKFRQSDTSAVLIFITSMAQYAVRGYEVNAFDYVIKPVNYYSFSLKMKRAIQAVNARREQQYIINTKNGFVKISRRDILYVEVNGHHIIYHTEQGDFRTYGSMKEVVQKLNDPAFTLCNNCYCVNMNHVTAVENFTVKLGTIELQISHPKKKEFLRTLNAYIGGSSI